MSYSLIEFKGQDLPDSYLNMIRSRWLRSLRYGNEYFSLIEPDFYFKAYGAYLDKLLDLQDTQVRMAALSDDKDVILGFSVYRGQALDYIHIQKDFRKIGIYKVLVPENITTFTHITKKWKTLWKHKYKTLFFNPFI